MLGEQLISAAKNGNLILVKELLDQNVPVNHQNKYGETALILAAFNGYPEVVQKLIKAGASLDIQDYDKGWTALMRAAYTDLEVVQDSAD